MNDNLFLLTQRIKKRENDILYNKMQIQKLEINLKIYKNPMTLKQICQKKFVNRGLIPLSFCHDCLFYVLIF